MRKSIARALMASLTAVASFGAFGTTPASADHLCDITVAQVRNETIKIDDPFEGAAGVVYVCIDGAPVDCEFGGGVHVPDLSPPTVDPVVYPPCQPHV